MGQGLVRTGGRRWVVVAAAVLAVLVAAGVVAAGLALVRQADGTADSPPATFDRYVALGDSYTSAPGVPVMDVAAGCFRSSQNYPSLVAERLGVGELVDRSCGGATTVHVTTRQFPRMPPQLRAVTADTDLVTVGLGANNQGIYLRLLRVCPRLAATDPSGSPCRDSRGNAGRRALLEDAAGVETSLTDALRLVEERAPEARIVVVGYPTIVRSGTTCPRRTGLALGDHAYVDEGMGRLDAALRAAADAVGATFVDVRSATREHGICSSDPWINDRTGDPGRATALHPFAAEQRAAAELVLDALR